MRDDQRNKGVGYFASYSGDSPSQVSSPPLHATDANGSMSSSISLANESQRTSLSNDEALNFEYLRNVILQFLDRPEMRPHLVSVLGLILHFTPAEQRRLAAKVAAAK